MHRSIALVLILLIAASSCGGGRRAMRPDTGTDDLPAVGDELARLLDRLGERSSSVPDPIVDGLAAIGPRAVPALMQATLSSDLDRCGRAFKALARLASEHPEVRQVVVARFTEAVAAPIGDAQSWLAAWAVDDLAELAAPLVPALVGHLERDQSQDSAINAFVAAVGGVGPNAAAATPALIRLLDDGKPESDWDGVTRALTNIGAGAVPDLITALDDRRKPVGVLRVLRRIAGDAAAAEPAIRRRLVDAEADVRAEAVRALLATQPSAVDAAMDRMADGSAAVRAAAIQAIAVATEHVAAADEPILRALGDPDGEVRRFAAWAARRAGSAAVAPLATACGDGDAAVRIQAVISLAIAASGTSEGFDGFTDELGDAADAPARRQAAAALTTALGDADEKVGANAAHGLGLLDVHDEAVTDALLAAATETDAALGTQAADSLRRLGLPQRCAVRVVAMLHDPEPRLRALGATLGPKVADPRPLIAPLIALLDDADVGCRGASADALARIPLDDPSAWPRLVLAVEDDATQVGAREALARAADGVVEELIAALARTRRPADLLLALSGHGAAAAPAVEAIRAVLADHTDDNQPARVAALGCLQAIGAAAAPARAAARACLTARGSDERVAAAKALAAIGPLPEEIPALIDVAVPDDGYELGGILLALATSPDASVAFFDRYATPLLTRDEFAIEQLFVDGAGACDALRGRILEHPLAPPVVLARHGDVAFLPRILERMRDAPAYRRIQLAALARALGAPAERTVEIDTDHPGDFRPPSAWPRVDRRRVARHANGHGDGYTQVTVTGRIRFTDGTSPASVRFTELNGPMLLGDRVEQDLPVRYDPQSGRFVCFTSVFAAYSEGDGAEMDGPFQTGSNHVRIDAAGARPLHARFFDEMPDVRITLTTQR